MAESLDDKIFEDFKSMIKEKGYPVEKITSRSDLYNKGLRFIHVIPTELWMDLKQVQSEDEKEPITKVFTKINPALTKYVSGFYDTIREISSALNRQHIITAPTCAADDIMVIYVGLKP